MFPLALVAYVLGAGMFFGNGLTIVAVFRVEKLRTRANMYIVSLAATDALVGLLLFVVGTFYIPSIQSWFDSTALLCVGMYAWGYCTTVCSGLNMCLIALDRYVYIAKPFLYEQFVTERKIGCAILLVWVLAFAYGTVPLYYNHFDGTQPCSMTGVIPVVFRSFASTSVFAFFCVFTAFFYLQISVLTLKHKRQIAQGPTTGKQSNENPHRLRMTRRSLKALKLFVVVFGLLFLCWSPYFIVDFASVFTGEVDETIYKALLMLGFLNSGVNMFIYPYFNKDFRAAMKSLLCCCSRSSNSNSNVIHVRSVTEWNC